MVIILLSFKLQWKIRETQLLFHPGFLSTVYDGAGSCVQQMRVCVNDAVCNRYLAPVLQACMAEQCNHDRCRQATQQFYGSMPHNVAEMLHMCECDSSDQSCLHMQTAFHSGTCGDETWTCQDTVSQCEEDRHCRYAAVFVWYDCIL